MSKDIILSDIDGTVCPLIGPSLAKYQLEAGLMDPNIYKSFVQTLEDFKAGKTAYEQFASQYLELYAQGLAGQTYADISRSTRDFLTRDNYSFFYPQLRGILDSLSTTHNLIFITATPQFIAEIVAETFGAQRFVSSILGVEDGLMTGKVEKSLTAREEKDKEIDKLASELGQNSIAFGDTIGDIKMLEAVKHPVCINPDNELRRIASERGYRILDLSTFTTEDAAELVKSQAFNPK